MRGGKISDQARIELMLEEICNIESFLKGTDNLNGFASNKILCHAVIYNLQCLGENVYKLSPEFQKEHPEMDWASIEGLRHVLVHDYYQVSMERIWAILQDDLPGLKDYLKNI